MPPPPQVDNIFVFFMAPVPARWLFKTSATSWWLANRKYILGGPTKVMPTYIFVCKIWIQFEWIDNIQWFAVNAITVHSHTLGSITRSSADADKPARRVWRSFKVTKHSTIRYATYSFLLSYRLYLTFKILSLFPVVQPGHSYQIRIYWLTHRN